MMPTDNDSTALDKLGPAPADGGDLGELLKVERMPGPRVDIEAKVRADFERSHNMWQRFVRADEPFNVKPRPSPMKLRKNENE